MQYPAHIAQRIFERIKSVFNVEVEGLEGFLETPPDPKMGDYAFPCFKLSCARDFCRTRPSSAWSAWAAI